MQDRSPLIPLLNTIPEMVPGKTGGGGVGVGGTGHMPGSLPVGMKPTDQRQVLSSSAMALIG